MTFLEIQNDAMERLNLTSAEARTRVKRYVNEWHRRILSRLGMSRLRDASATINVVAGTAEYVVSVPKIASIYDATNKVRLVERSLAWLRDTDPGGSQTAASPLAYVVRKVSPSSATVRLWPTPTANLTLAVDAQGAVSALSADGDVPALPEDYHWLLSLGARVSEYEKLDDDRLKGARVDLEEGVRELRHYLARSNTRTFSQGSAPAPERSEFGANFPRS